MMTWEQIQQAVDEGRAREEWRQEEGYGPFPGGDPRLFTPDPECSTPEEQARWKDACALVAEGGMRNYVAQCRLMGDGAVHTGKGFGLGTYKTMIHYWIVRNADGLEEEYF